MCSTIIFSHSTNQIIIFWLHHCRCCCHFRRPFLSSLLLSVDEFRWKFRWIQTEATTGCWSGRYRVKYNPTWAINYPVKAATNDRLGVCCIKCARAISSGHQGPKGVKVHCQRESHKKRIESSKKKYTHLPNYWLDLGDSTSKNVIKAEVMLANFLEQHHLSIATTDHFGPLLKEMFPDSKIAASYASGPTKTSAVINIAMGSYCHRYLIEHCKTNPFTLGIDGSIETGVDKMNPVNIHIFDFNRSKSVISIMTCASQVENTTSGEHCYF